MKKKICQLLGKEHKFFKFTGDISGSLVLKKDLTSSQCGFSGHRMLPKAEGSDAHIKHYPLSSPMNKTCEWGC